MHFIAYCMYCVHFFVQLVLFLYFLGTDTSINNKKCIAIIMISVRGVRVRYVFGAGLLQTSPPERRYAQTAAPPGAARQRREPTASSQRAVEDAPLTRHLLSFGDALSVIAR